MDMEKVVNGLEIARKLVWNGEHCNIMDADDALTVSYAITDALALLKAQEPKPPIIKENSYGWKFYYCPSCGKEFYQNNKFSFCEKCGQAVKWE